MELNNVKITISQYSKDEDVYLDTFTFTFEELVKYVAKYQEYYWRIELFGKTKKLVSGIHFGCNVSSMGSLYLTEADYLNGFLNYMVKDQYNYQKKTRDKKTIRWNFWDLINRDNWVLNRIAACAENKKTDFYNALNQYLNEINIFQEVFDLKCLDGLSGIYCMVLDKYNVCYVGQSKDMKSRILQHWGRNDYTTSGIDLFKALDTTRIYVFGTDPKDSDLLNMAEILSLDRIYGSYCLNFFPGGSFDNMCRLQDGLEKLKQHSRPNEMSVMKFYKLTKQDDPEAIHRIERFVL